MSAIVTLGDINEPIRTDPPLVEVREDWGDGWTTLLAECEYCTFASGGRMGTAKISGEYGRIKRSADGSVWHIFQRQGGARLFVRITIPLNTGPPIQWHGVIISVADVEEGAKILLDPHGTLHMTAYSFDWVLAKKQVLFSMLEAGGGALRGIDRGLAFNAQDAEWDGTRQPAGNMHPPVDVTSNHFSFLPHQGLEWDAYQIIKYLFRYHQPMFAGPKFIIDPAWENGLNWLRPANVRTHGRTLLDIIQEVLDQRRAISWFLDVNESTNQIILRVATHALSNVALPSGEVLPMNPNTAIVVHSASRQVSTVQFDDHNPRYEQIILQGARRGAICTLSVEQGQLIKDWTDEQEQAYSDGAKDSEGYAGLWGDSQQLHNDTLRNAPPLNRVFTHYRLSELWAGKTTDGSPAFPNLLADGSLGNTSIQLWPAGMRLNLRLPLLANRDYSGDPANPTIIGIGESRDQLEGMVLLRYFRAAAPNVPEATVWFKVDDTAALGRNEIFRRRGIGWAANVQSYQAGPGIIVQPNTMPHVMALEDYDPSTAAPSSVPTPDVSYKSLLATVFIEGDAPVEIRHPVPPANPINNFESKLIVQLGDHFRLDYLVPDTVLGIKDDGTLIHAAGGFVRDDRLKMRDVAKLAYDWYSIERQALRLHVPYFEGRLTRGVLVTQLVSFPGKPMNTLVTSVEYDFTRGGETRIQTAAAEALDLGAFTS